MQAILGHQIHIVKIIDFWSKFLLKPSPIHYRNEVIGREPILLDKDNQ